MFGDAAAETFAETGLTPDALDAVFVGNFMADLIEDQGHVGPLLVDAAGAREAASVRFESACASGGVTLRHAVDAVESGRARAVLAGGVEVMSVADIEHVTDALANAADDHGLDAPVTVLGTGQSSDALALQDRASVSRIPAAERAATAAYEDAGITPGDVDVAEVHDCFTIAEVLALEALDFYDRGTGARGAVAGETAVDGSTPVNTSGGLIGKGHPVGATGIGQVVELTKQLEGRHPNQVDDAEVALAHNVGGSGASTTVTVLGGA